MEKQQQKKLESLIEIILTNNRNYSNKRWFPCYLPSLSVHAKKHTIFSIQRTGRQIRHESIAMEEGISLS